MRPIFVKLLLISAGMIVLGLLWGCTYGQYEPDLWAADSPILQQYQNQSDDDDDDNDNDDNDDNNDDSDADSDSDKDVQAIMHRIPPK